MLLQINQQLTNHSNTSTEILDLLSFSFMKILRQNRCELRYLAVRLCASLFIKKIKIPLHFGQGGVKPNVKY